MVRVFLLPGIVVGKLVLPLAGRRGVLIELPERADTVLFAGTVTEDSRFPRGGEAFKFMIVLTIGCLGKLIRWSVTADSMIIFGRGEEL